MKQKFSFKSLLMAFMALGLVVTTFTSCDNKEDEINALTERVGNLEKSLKDKLDTGLAKVQKAVEDAQKAADNAKKVAEDAQKAADNAATGGTALAEQAKKDAQKAAEDAKKAQENADAVKTKAETLEKEVADLKGKVAKLEPGKKGDDNAKNLEKEIDALSKKIDGMVGSAVPLTSLVLLPDYVSKEGGALPFVKFSPLNTDECGHIVPEVKIRYVLNPATVTEKQIKEVRLRYNDPIAARGGNNSRQAAVKPEVTKFEAKDGILTIWAKLDTKALWDSANAGGNTDNRIDQLMAEVVLNKVEKSVVSSDWVKVVAKPEELAIVKVEKRKSDTHTWDFYEVNRFAKTVAPHNKWETAEGVEEHEEPAAGDDVVKNTKNYTVVELEYNKEVDLTKHVKAMFTSKWTAIKVEDYGLNWKFDLNNHETGKPIVYELGSNKTDQQQFIKLHKDGKTISTKVYSKTGNRAAVDRTPIVHVMLVGKNKDGECIARHGYIKINIVEPKVDPVPPVKYPSELEARCIKAEDKDLDTDGTKDIVVDRIGTQKMNEDFYHKVNMRKEEFHVENGGKYTFEQVAKIATDATNVGTIIQVKDDKDTESYNLVYTLTEAEVWANVGKKVWREATYTNGGHVIKMKFETTITKPVVKLDLTIDNYWYNGYENVVHNVAVPTDGSTDHAKCTWKNNISAAFKTVTQGEYNATEDANVGVQLLDLPSQGYKDHTYEYIFDKDNQPLKNTGVDGITLSVMSVAEAITAGIPNDVQKVDVNGDGTVDANDKIMQEIADYKELDKVLVATKGTESQVVAVIQPQEKGVTTGDLDYLNDGDILQYNDKEGSFAHILLNHDKEFMKARVILVVKNSCGKRVDVEVKNLPAKDRFNVSFVRPINVKKGAAKNFVDAVDFGAEGSYIDMKEVAQLEDWRNYIKNLTKYDFLPNNENYYEYYNVTEVKADIANIKPIGLKVSGVDVTSLPNTIEIKQTANGDTFKGKTYQFGRLTYKNNGTNLKEEFKIEVPITVTYKWGEVKSVKVIVTVKPSATK